jgi:hypothetical protein
MRKVVLVNDIARQPAMVSHGESLLLSPGAYLAASLPARCRPGSGARPRKQQARMLDKRCKLAAELGRMPGAQIYLVEHAVQAEPHGLVGRAASQVILKMHFDPLHSSPELRIVSGARPRGELAVESHSLPRTDVSRTQGYLGGVDQQVVLPSCAETRA